MAETKNYLLLDIDGVVAPTDGQAGEKVIDGIVVNAPYANWYVPERAASMLYYFAIRQERGIKGSGGYNSEVLWSSAWTEESNHINKELHIENFRSLPFDDKDFDESNENGVWFKEHDLKDFVLKHRTEDNVIIIVDDEMSESFIDWAKDFANVHTLKPEPTEGLTDQDVDKIIGELYRRV